jgi:MFS family permease
MESTVSPAAPTAPHRARWIAGLTRNVWVLGLVSLLTDVSSEMITPLRVLFLVGVLNTPLPIVGLIEGLAESLAGILKILAGRLAGRAPRRKPVILAGYTLSNLARPLLALAGAWPQALGLIALDRVGKGLRTSPRDALLADAAPAAHRGKAFGFHRALDMVGATIGPLIAFGILALTNQDLRRVFAWTVVPGLLAVGVLLFFLHEERRARAPEAGVAATTAAPVSRRRQIVALGPRFWLFTAIATVFALGNSSSAFLFLGTQIQGVAQPLHIVPLIYFAFNVVYALLAAPLGALGDRWGRVPTLVVGYGAFGLVYAGWAGANQGWHAWVLFLAYGVYAAATEGVARAFVTDLAPREQRGAALGWFIALMSGAALPANLLAGWLWSTFGHTATFGFGAWLGFTAMALLLVLAPWLSRERPFLSPGVPEPDWISWRTVAGYAKREMENVKRET